MNILTFSYTLDLAGTPTFTLTMYNELVKQNHKVTVYSPLGGKLETLMHMVKTLDDLQKPDVIIAQHIPCAVDLKNAFPNIPFIFYCHGFVQEIEQPPPFTPDCYMVINEECRNNYINKGIPANQITIIRDFIDTTRFSPQKPINKKLSRVLFLSNYKKWKNFKAVWGACDKLGLQLRCCGSPYGRNYHIEEAINEADLVISWARGILEAMSCGRAALSFDRFEGDGYIDATTYYEARQDNFSGRHFHYAYTADTLAQEMSKYDPTCGKKNRELILAHHGMEKGVDQILNIIKKIQR